MKRGKKYKMEEDVIPEVLSGVGKKNPYRVPDGYFDTLTSRVLNSIESSPKIKSVRPIMIRLHPRLRAVAASIAILLFAGITYALITEVILPAVRENNTPETVQPSNINRTNASDSSKTTISDINDSFSPYTPSPFNVLGSLKDVSKSGENQLTNKSTFESIGRPVTSSLSPSRDGAATSRQTGLLFTNEFQQLLPYLSDTVICQGNTLHYKILFDREKYEAVWAMHGQPLMGGSQGIFSLSTTELKAGTYRLTMMLIDKNTRQYAHVQNASLTIAVVPNITGEKNICDYNQARLTAGPQNPYWDYLWSTGENTSDISVTKSGKYWVRIGVKGGNCSSSDTFDVKIFSHPTLNLGADRTICAGDQFSLKVNNQDNQFVVRWFPGNIKSNEYLFNKKEPGLYKISVELAACKTLVDEVVIQVVDCHIAIPNVFTPNGDGINDLFVIKGLDSYQASKLVVTDRNGQKVFESNDYKNNWDGANLPEGTYFYILYPGGDDSSYRKGTISLLR